VPEPVENWTQGPVTLLGDAAHLMLQYFAQGAAMAMEDAVCIASCADEAGGDFPAAFQRYQALRLMRASRVQISAAMLGLLFHASGAARLVRNEIYTGRSIERHYEALDRIFSAPDYVRGFDRTRV
jgi:3-hydroxybenzoate 6-monooxygenase